MPTSLGPAVRARLPLPDLLERGQPNTLRAPLEDSGGPVSATSARLSITRGSTTLLDDVAATIVSGVPTYEWAPASTLELGDVVVRWTIVTASYGTLSVRNDGVVCRVRLLCPIGAADLWPLAPSLNPAGDSPVSAMTLADFDAAVGEAWIAVQQRLLTAGRRQHLVIGAHALREVCQHHTLAIVWGALAHRLNEAYRQLAIDHGTMLEAAWGRVRLVYDESDDGEPDAGRKAGQPAVLWIG